MLTKNEVIQTLNGLIETCKDGQEGFWTAADSMSDPSIRQVFIDYSKQRSLFAGELQAMVQQMGGTPETDGSPAAAFRRGWVNIKEAVTGKDEQKVLKECVFAEDIAVSTFRNALEKGLPPEITDVVRIQYDHILEGHDRVRNLKVVVFEPTRQNEAA